MVFGCLPKLVYLKITVARTAAPGALETCLGLNRGTVELVAVGTFFDSFTQSMLKSEACGYT